MSADACRSERGYVKGKLTRLISYISDVQAQKIVPTQEDLEVRIERIESVNLQFAEIQNKLIQASEKHELEAHDIKEDEEFERRFLDAKAVLTRWVNAMKTASSTRPAPPQTADHFGDTLAQVMADQAEILRTLTNRSSLGRESHIKFPTIHLPTFDGNVENWKRFHDTFNTLVHNSDLSNVQKHQYLVGALSGSAAKLIESIDISDDNYSIAWGIIKKRYEDEKSIRKRHIKSLFNMPQVAQASEAAIQELIDHTRKHLNVLKGMKLPTDTWDELIIFMMEEKLDKTTRMRWEEYIETRADITVEVLIDFLQRRCKMLDRINAGTNSNGSRMIDACNKPRKEESSFTQKRVRNDNLKFKQSYKPVSLTTSKQVSGRCYMCNGSHFIYSCDKFLGLPVDERIQEVRKLKLCLNCLRNDHFIRSCKAGPCRECSQRHNTLCHKSSTDATEVSHSSSSTTATKVEPSRESQVLPSVSTHHSSSEINCAPILMSTAVVNAASIDGSNYALRVLLDSASEANFITRSTCNKLGLKCEQISGSISGLNGMTCTINNVCRVTIRSRVSDYQLNVLCLVVPKISKQLPSVELRANSLSIPNSVKLADPFYFAQGNIDILLGGEFFVPLLEPGKLEIGANMPVLQNSKFGWIVSGPIPASIITQHTIGLTSHLTCLQLQGYSADETLKRFWEIEEYQPVRNNEMTDEEKACEESFVKTHSRDETGRFVVRLPFREKKKLGESKEAAKRRLIYLERKFKSNTTFRDMYHEFMREYDDLRHMTEVQNIPSQSDSSRTIVYLPHHGVIQNSGNTTKLRVVFDASAKTDSGISLNESLMVGPTIQDNLIDIVLRFRLHRFVITGDLRKMYRQILVHKADRDYQRILWRFSPDEPIREFQLNTVTYGQCCAPFLAIRCVRQLANEGRERYPLASHVLLNDLYVDDLLTGVNDVQEGLQLIKQLQELLNAGQFQVHKWRSNFDDVLGQDTSNYSNESRAIVDEHGAIKTLGLEWDPKDDSFHLSVQSTIAAKTKREILSEISKLFDPLGLVSPVVIRAKFIMQRTWQLNLDWDEEVPDDLLDIWKSYMEDLKGIINFRIPRQVSGFGSKMIILHAFCDASERAYGACVYVQSQNKENILQSVLLCSKSRVAPVKKVTLPRLELCGALILSRLVHNVRTALHADIIEIHAWSDSTVALAWIAGDTARQKTFVSHRVTEIRSQLNTDQWHHVRSEDNPADLISRGVSSEYLETSKLWWSGPHWLPNFRAQLASGYSKVELSNDELEIVLAQQKAESRIFMTTNETESIINNIVNKYSSLTKIERVLAWCRRFISNLRIPRENRVYTNLSIQEIDQARQCIIIQVQSDHFAKEIKELQGGSQLSPNNKIVKLSPFLDSNQLLRVGGRLQRATLKYGVKHQILLPDKCRFTALLFRREHLRLLHGGPQALLFSIRENYWPINGKNIARKILHECTTCFRVNPSRLTQIMGQLPPDRVSPRRAFLTAGVDFAGPIITLMSKGRGRKTTKSYISLFVCFSTKSIHLEAVSDLSSAAFIAALRRFTGRRGCPQKIYCDNATNFIGAHNELREIYQLFSDEYNDFITEFCATKNIEWKFNPPAAPHMGGLWEAGVKSCKHHLKRVIGDTLLTYEELSTVLIQIEACLNSRPLCQLSTTPFDLQPLTPSHFLIGEPLTTIPDPDLCDLPVNRLSRWQLLQRMTQHFWKRWSLEYVTSLQGKSKWSSERDNLAIDDIVIIQDPNAPPLQWKLGRVIELHPGTDTKVRVVTLKTANSTCKRAITKLCKLPIASKLD